MSPLSRPIPAGHPGPEAGQKASCPARTPRPQLALARLRTGERRPAYNAAARALIASSGSGKGLLRAATAALLRELAAGRSRASCVVGLGGPAAFRLWGARLPRPQGGSGRGYEAFCRLEPCHRDGRRTTPQRSRRRAAVDALLYPVWLTDAAGEVVHANPPARTFGGWAHGVSPALAKGPWPLATVHPADRAALVADWQRALTTAQPLEIGCRLQADPGGPFRWQLARAQPQRSARGQVRGWVVTLEDQHETHQMREDLRSAACLRDNFLRVASHELSTPLTSLQLALQLAQVRVQRLAPEPERRAPIAEPIGRALADTRRLVDLVSDLLDIKRLQAGKFFLRRSPVHLGELLREVLARLDAPLREANCRVTFHEDAQSVGAWDVVRLQQVFFHLLNNAIKYAPGSHLFIHCGEALGTAHVTVEDEGPGIPVGLRKKIFSLFERATEVRGTSGLGMGLYLCRRIVHAHRGNLRLVCRGTKGAKFIVSLPCAPPAEAAEPQGCAWQLPKMRARPLHG